MINEFDMVDREDENISSGETLILMIMQEEWQRLYHLRENSLKPSDRNRRWTYEDVVENPIPFLNEIGRLTVIPTYQYVLNYIFFQVNLAVGRKNQKLFAIYLQEGIFPETIDSDIDLQCRELMYHESEEDEKIFGHKELDIIYQQLVKRLAVEFIKNGYTRQIDWPVFLKETVEEFNFGKLKELAFGLHMSLEDFEIFLCKVLKRSDINFYEREEVFIYLVLRYADYFGCSEYFKAYDRLQELYGNVQVQSDEHAQWSMESVSTVYIRKKMEDLQKSIEGNPFREKNSVLAAYISQIDYQNRRLEGGEIVRTAKKRFNQIWNDMKEKWKESDQVQELIRADREKNKKSPVVSETGLYRKEMTVRYYPGMDILIPKGARFHAKTLIKSREVKEEAVFKTYQDIVLKSSVYEEIEVKVKALLSMEEYRKYCNEKNIQKDVQFLKEEHFKEWNIQKGIEIDSPELKDLIRNIRIGSKLRFADSPAKKNEGTLIIECMVGTFIPAGTRFHFELEGMIFSYESTAPANVQEYTLEVKPLQLWSAMNPDESVLKRNDTIKKYEKFELYDDQDKNKNESGIVSAFAGKANSIGYFGDGQKKHLVTVVCKKNCTVPKGTIFRYRTESSEFLYETVDDFNIRPYAEAKIETIWDNKDYFQKYVNKNAKPVVTKEGVITNKFKEAEILPSDVEFRYEIDNVYSVSGKKRTVLEPEMGESGGNNYEVKDSALLRFIYDAPTENATGISYYKGIPSYGEDFLLNTQLFRNTKLIQRNFSVLTSNEERLRNYILTLKFLEFVWWYCEDESKDNGLKRFDILKTDINTEDFYMLIDDFHYEADKELRRCGFQPFYPTGFPYDAFLVLLLSCDDPLALFQDIWSDKGMLFKVEKEKKNGKSTA